MSKSAYFLAKNISQIPYMCLAPLIYLSLYYTFTAPRATFGDTYLILAAAQVFSDLMFGRFCFLTMTL